MSSPYVMVSVVLGEEGLGSLWENSGWFISANLIYFFFACLEAIYPIYLIFVVAAMFTILKRLEIFSSPDMSLQSSSLLVTLTCLGVTVICFVLKSYWLTSEIACVVRTLVARSSSYIYISLVYR